MQIAKLYMQVIADLSSADKRKVTQLGTGLSFSAGRSGKQVGGCA